MSSTPVSREMQSAAISGTWVVLASVFTMSFVSFLALVLIWRDDAVEAAP